MTTQTRHILLGQAGGEDLVSPGIAQDPSRLVYSHNVEMLPTGGVSRIAGYVLFDGQDEPTDPPPGNGDILGGCVFDNEVFVLQNHDAGAGEKATLYRATSSGWSLVDTGDRAGVRAEFVVGNFSGTAASNLYWVDGNNLPQEMGVGPTYTVADIDPGANYPSHIEIHRGRLWVSYNDGTVRYSPVGTPSGTWGENWATTGAIGVGAPIVGLKSMKGGVLAIFCESKTHLLYGSYDTEFDLREHSQEVGAYEWSIAEMGDCLFVNRVGVTSLAATDAFGDFASSQLSYTIKPVLDPYKTHVAGAVAIKDRQQYRVVFSDAGGSPVLFGLVVSPTQVNWTRGRYGFDVCAIWRGEIDDVERVFAAGTDGNVYELDTGTSFNGAEYRSIWTTAYDAQGEPASYKHYRKVLLELKAGSTAALKYQAVFDYDETGIPKGLILDADIEPSGTRWGIGVWNSFDWGGAQQGTAYGYLTGWAQSISLTFTVSSATEPPMTINSVSYLYETRRLER